MLGSRLRRVSCIANVRCLRESTRGFVHSHVTCNYYNMYVISWIHCKPDLADCITVVGLYSDFQMFAFYNNADEYVDRFQPLILRITVAWGWMIFGTNTIMTGCIVARITYVYSAGRLAAVSCAYLRQVYFSAGSTNKHGTTSRQTVQHCCRSYHRICPCNLDWSPHFRDL